MSTRTVYPPPTSPLRSSKVEPLRRVRARQGPPAGAARLLVVDDEEIILEFLAQLLREVGFAVVTASSADAAMRILEEHEFDLLLTDLKMPGKDGMALIEHALGLGRPMRAIALTAYMSVETAIRALKLGADNYITKPFKVDEVLLAVHRALERQRLILENEAYQRNLEDKIEERTQALDRAHRDLQVTYDETLRAIASLLEHKERDAGGHALRVAHLTARIAEAMELPEAERVDVWRGALLHDIGKFAIPDAILFKREPLAPNEETILNTYCVIGFKALEGIRFLEEPARIVLHHQERWNGSGYPCGLVGEEIPLGARIFAVASALQEGFDGGHDRPGLEIPAARAAVAGSAGELYDPAVVEALMRLPEEAIVEAMLP